MSDQLRPLTTWLVDSTAAMISGVTTGRNSNGSITSLARTLTDIAAKSVPTELKPIAVSRLIASISHRNTTRLNNTANTGRTTTNATVMKRKLPRALPRNIRSRLIGASISASRVLPSTSRANARLRPVTPAKATAAQSTPGPTNFAMSGVRLSEKVKITRTNSANPATATTTSLLRSSSSRSLRPIDQMTASESLMRQDLARGLAQGRVSTLRG